MDNEQKARAQLESLLFAAEQIRQGIASGVPLPYLQQCVRNAARAASLADSYLELSVPRQSPELPYFLRKTR